MSVKRKIVAIVGMPGAGKSSAGEILKKNGFTLLRFGDQTDIGLKEMDLSLTEKNERRYREQLRKTLGMAAYAIKLKPRLEKALKDNQKIALDGLYSWEEYLHLKKYYKDLILLCIYARPDIRYARLYKRKIRGLDRKEAVARDIAELDKLNKGGPIAITDYLIENNHSKRNLKLKIEDFLNFLIER